MIGFVLWFAYGVALGNWALIIPNTIAFVVGATTIAVARHYRPRGGLQLAVEVVDRALAADHDLVTLVRREDPDLAAVRVDRGGEARLVGEQHHAHRSRARCS